MNRPRYAQIEVYGLMWYAVLLFMVVSLIILAGCKNDATELAYEEPAPGNYTQMDWIDGYDAFHKQISEQYAFGEWKDIDWNALNYEIRPKITQALYTNDEAAYATAILEYVRSIPDGHVFIRGELLENLQQEQIAGSYGIGIMGLDDGRVIAHIVTAQGPASNAGIEVGDAILQWNGMPIETALEQVSTLWRFAQNSLATDEYTILEKYRMLVLDPIDTRTTVTFSKANGAGNVTATMTAADDNGTIFMQTALPWMPDIDNLIQYRVLDSGYGYVRIGALILETTSEKFKEALQFFSEQNVPGIIVDLRGNAGGEDTMAAEFSGYFYSETTLYEYIVNYNALSGNFDFVYEDDDEARIGDIPVNIEPQTPSYSGPVIAIVNPATISSGEGIAMAIKNLPQGHVVGFWGTNGSFGMTGGQAFLPGGYTIGFPIGRSLDKYKTIQLDSRNGIGGVSPSIPIPMTAENAIKLGALEDVELEYAVSILDNM